MAVVIRMKRTGRKNRPCYRISVADKSLPRDGRTIENLGHYDPASPVEGLRLSLDVERARHWVEHGAVPSHTVRSIFKAQGVYGEPTPKQKRDRSGRKKVTAKRARRVERDRARDEAKAARRDDRARAAREAKAAAAAAESSDSEG